LKRMKMEQYADLRYDLALKLADKIEKEKDDSVLKYETEYYIHIFYKAMSNLLGKGGQNSGIFMKDGK